VFDVFDVFDVVRKSTIPLGDQLVERVSELIESGRLPEGSRLPSVRQLARRIGVSVYTVTSAFERLSAKGLIDARAGAGYFVAPVRSRRGISRIEFAPLGNQCNGGELPRHPDVGREVQFRGG
jgi:DNA-binding transcriptional regulator YhcF (GntR family)